MPLNSQINIVELDSTNEPGLLAFSVTDARNRYSGIVANHASIFDALCKPTEVQYAAYIACSNLVALLGGRIWLIAKKGNSFNFAMPDRLPRSPLFRYDETTHGKDCGLLGFKPARNLDGSPNHHFVITPRSGHARLLHI